MSSDGCLTRLKDVLRRQPEWRTPIESILNALSGVPEGGLLDPMLVAKMVGLEPLITIGYLNVLREAGCGEFVIRVVDGDGQEVRRFPSVADIPGEVENEFGEWLTVMPENVDISFEPVRQRYSKIGIGS
jgi:hypothetical protein